MPAPEGPGMIRCPRARTTIATLLSVVGVSCASGCSDGMPKYQLFHPRTADSSKPGTAGASALPSLGRTTVSYQGASKHGAFDLLARCARRRFVLRLAEVVDGADVPGCRRWVLGGELPAIADDARFVGRRGAVHSAERHGNVWWVQLTPTLDAEGQLEFRRDGREVEVWPIDIHEFLPERPTKYGFRGP